MCGLCGVFLTEGGWADAPVGSRTRGHERMHRVALANRVLRLFAAEVSDWNGASYVVRSATGQTAMVESMAALCQSGKLANSPWTSSRSRRRDFCSATQAS
jgi:hypothetical protein